MQRERDMSVRTLSKKNFDVLGCAHWHMQQTERIRFWKLEEPKTLENNGHREFSQKEEPGEPGQIITLF